ncbi:hypothetical protein VTL71DRAFT_10189 [Oculimacula yallundae]|uniref:Uncharacterized protein n=1 Tax=Oculimacula yallundae TaxID=86028 RepID=A0ABR4BQ10_9HELO
MPRRLVFVPTDEAGTIQSAERQLIRRHCMQQKNKKTDSRRSIREAARAASLHDPENHELSCIVSSPLVPVASTTNSTHSHSKSHARERPKQMLSEASSRRSIIPSPPPSDWALFQFPGNLEVSSQKLMHQCFIRNPIRDPLCPFKLFGISIDFDQDPFWCFRLLASDELCFHAILVLNSSSNDRLLQKPLSKTTYRHLRDTLPILNKRLAEKEAFKDDLILYVVGILASISILFRDYDAAKIHAIGLSEIIRLRGGISAIDQNPLIKFAIDRLNFSSMLVTNSWKPIYDGAIWEKPLFSNETYDVCRSRTMMYIDTVIDSNLAVVFHTLRCTTILLNKHYYNQTPVDGKFLQECLGFIHTKLIELEGQLGTHLSECLHLGMMTFLATTFRIPGLYELPYSKSLSNKLQVAYFNIKDSIPDLQSGLDIWLIFVYLISADIIDSSWTELCSQATRGLSWDEIKLQLKEVMWIDTFHDDLGKMAVQKCSAL